ncbi:MULTISPECIES: 23S rRNA (uracil(1939)-C(5))-methyltransferase RlmD [Chromobacterium]|uniref:23S rRNA (uracil(1939)-C(5))-methyltransferase RlmD n=1 Tax=Chromobacterium haemolyticum TaxID=394935 RepID=A0ABS3GIP3_9NEIS|nr:MULTISPECIES: 23S rRNA (uracil(1939)-C(5))-methyltransferase RlmD [Chromobacterium]MBK0413808.1 23S rRNA (uracil(1939)-C(5))-methyltransferase RlmD [Chromobacterium haemolyticum]MBO0414910.1 23S rRNA (uracil(1939)-C(5))-methyltransferase RlmD [Chromobacterium haemolyticum]MBO0498171.1 23S rRNA (uracil(1939)-C(5))-methyltransferase RlmD [Chromobacterium haemolyticum]MDH0343130.1 23S rRNA (uracil(1939)-C(5))-methyltransferase RlmD [Chromobacterium haemolyticum]OQS34609.1 23S rRNA (uracil(1939
MTHKQTIAQVESLDHEGRGVAHVDGKTIFIDGALPYETVVYSAYRKKSSYENANTSQVLKESFLRTQPRCPHYGTCGGCSMQHVEFSAQVAVKQRVLEDNLARIGRVKPQQVLTPIAGPAWHYRHRARMSARLVEKKGGVLVGFHEKRSTYITDMRECHILPRHISDLIVPLREMIYKLSINNRMPQVELAVGDKVDILVFRNMEAINDADHALLRAFSDAHGSKERPLQMWLQPKGPDTCYPVYPLDAPKLTYSLPEYRVEMPYYPTEFTQVNPEINAVMVARALKFLDPQPGERIADMFCGIGNFTLPIARSGASVHGMEGSQPLVKRAVENATHNGLQDKVSYEMANLFEVTEESFAALGKFDKMLVDPPRDGAVQLLKAITEDTAPKRIVYVSCNPATLARDANVLVHTKGYTLKAAGIINMFPHTAHVESVAWFEKTGPCKSRSEIAVIEAAEEAEREAVKAAQRAEAAAEAAKKERELAEKAAAKQARRDYYFAEQARREAEQQAQ